MTQLGGQPVFGYVDNSKNIILSGKLAADTYTVKFEKEDGSAILDIGSLVLSDEPAMNDVTNLFDPSTAILNARIASSGTSQLAGCVIAIIKVSDYAPFTDTSKVYIRGGSVRVMDGSNDRSKIITYTFKPTASTLYNGYFSKLEAASVQETDVGNGVVSPTIVKGHVASNVTYMAITLRVSDTTITAEDIQDIVITINEPIYG